MVDSPQRPTLKTIAELTGLAVATVSRALKDAPDISASTKVRVRDVAQSIGYRPNRAGVRLRTGKTNVIALVLSMDENIMNHTAQLIYSISTTLKGSPYHMIVLPFSEADDPLTPVKYLVETGGCDGILLNQTEPNDPRVSYLMSINFPVATHGRTIGLSPHTYFDFDNAAFAKEAVRALHARGRRRIQAIAPPERHCYGQHFRDGFWAGVSECGVDGHILTDVSSDSLAETTTCRIRDLEGDVADGLVFASASSAMAGTVGMEQRGLTIGEDFDAVAKEAVPILNLFRNEMIVVQEDVARAGRFLAEALMAQIDGKEDAIWTELEPPAPLR